MHAIAFRPLVLAMTLVLGSAGTCAIAATATPQSDGTIVVDPGIHAAAYQVRLIGPRGLSMELTRLDDEVISLAPAKQGWADGEYRYEIWPITGVARRSDKAAAAPPSEPMRSVSGSFRVEGGHVFVAGASPSGSDRDVPDKDQVIPDDLIVQGSACVGLDCVNGESFGFDTLKLKENNLRILFDDTSTSAGFTANDWQLTANEDANGGLNKFSIEDITGAKIPFTIIAGAPTNSLFVDSVGNAGFGTSTPLLDLHVSNGNTPALRLEQTSAGGFTAQTWDVAGNEANFFVRDLTSGSRLPFRIRPGAPTSSLDISASGSVGIGTASPTATLDVVGNAVFSGGINNTVIGAVTPSPAKFANLTATGLVVMDTNAGFIGKAGAGLGGNWRYKDDTGTNRWLTGMLGSAGTTAFSFFNMAAGTEAMRITSANLVGIGTSVPTEKLHVAGNIFASGNITITGSLSQGSDRNSKENFATVDPDDVLDRLAKLDITRWNYKADGQQVQHIGPMAQDFYALFGLGEADTKIAPLDTSGVTIVAVQELARRLQQRDAELRERDAEIAALRDRLDRLDAQVAALIDARQPAATTVSAESAEKTIATTGL